MKSPLLGFNNNVRHKGRVFHIQTEDSGVKHPHIITHLFADGGRILKTTKTSYAEHIEDPAMAEKVRTMMQDQHKAMFVALREGTYDHLIDPGGERPSAPAAAPAPPAPVAPPSTVVPSSAEAASPMTTPSAAPLAAPPPAPPAPAVVVPAPVVRAIPAPPPPPAPAPAAPPAPPPASAAAQTPPATSPRTGPQAAAATMRIPQAQPRGTPEPTPAVQTAQAKPQRTSSRPAISLSPESILGPPKRSISPIGTAAFVQTTGTPAVDFDALERAAEAAQTPFIQQIQDLPPPPAAVLSKRAPMSQDPKSGVARPVSPAPATRTTPLPQEPPGGGSPGRYGQSRPASIFATTRPAEGMSIFGEDLISEKSLDEVILSYLAEDLESPDKK